MRVSGFTFVRNAVRLDYPVVESIRSILPIVDEFVVNVGQSDDDTRALIASIGSPKIRIVESVWNPNVRSGGYVLAQQTNIALFNCTGEWAIYLQADEAIHERDHQRLVALMEQYQADDRVEGLAMQRVSFYGDYQTVLNTYPWHLDVNVRVVKPHKFVLSRGDAAGFTVHPKYKERGHRIRAVDTGLPFFHYLDVRSLGASAQFRAQKTSLWTPGTVAAGARETEQLSYYVRQPRAFVEHYSGTHPAPMADRIKGHGAPLDLNSPLWRTELTATERKRQRRTWLIHRLGMVAAAGRGGRRIVASHRDR